jgi:AraC family ethanolamine operon transcriptional activator
MPSVGRAVVQRFRQFVDQHLDQPVAVTRICRALRVNERTLRAYCAQHLGMSPKQYHDQRRMERVRQCLLMANPTKTTVSAIATQHGFRQLGWFSVRYRERFGESPSVTLSNRLTRKRRQTMRCSTQA